MPEKQHFVVISFSFDNFVVGQQLQLSPVTIFFFQFQENAICANIQKASIITWTNDLALSAFHFQSSFANFIRIEQLYSEKALECHVTRFKVLEYNYQN